MHETLEIRLDPDWAPARAMSDRPTPRKIDTLDAEQAAALDRDGYLLFRSAVPEVWRNAVRSACSKSSGQR
jgi:hypothetical protein